MNKAEIAGCVARRTGLGRGTAAAAVDTVFDAIGEALSAGEDVRIAGFGTFTTRSRPARTGRNPRTGETLALPASITPTFKAGTVLRNTVKERRQPKSSA